MNFDREQDKSVINYYIEIGQRGVGQTAALAAVVNDTKLYNLMEQAARRIEAIARVNRNRSV